MAPPPFRRSLSVDTDHSEDGASSLSDSTYEIVSQSSINTSDDEYHFDDGTESVASDDDRADEQARDIAELSTAENGEHMPSLSYLVNYSPNESTIHVESSIETQLLIPSLSTSQVEVSTLRDEPIQEPNSISFDEHICSDGVAQGHCIHDIPCTNTVDGFTTVVIRQDMSAKLMKLDRPFRVFYWGPLSLKDAVIEKLAHIIAASAQFDELGETRVASKLSIVPMASSGTVMLIPASGYEIIVENITGYVRAARKGWMTSDIINLSTSSDINKPCRSDDFAKPDLAIFVYSDRDLEPSIEEDPSVTIPLSFHLRGLGVPVIHVAESLNAYPLQPSTGLVETVLGPGSLHFGSSTHDQYPVSWRTFLSINDRQLNRHLAYLTGLCEQTSTPTISFSNGDWQLINGQLLSKFLNAVSVFGGIFLTIISRAVFEAYAYGRTSKESLQKILQLWYSNLQISFSEASEETNRDINEHQQHNEPHDILTLEEQEFASQAQEPYGSKRSSPLLSIPVLIAVGVIISLLAGKIIYTSPSQPIVCRFTKTIPLVTSLTHINGASQYVDRALQLQTDISAISNTVDIASIEVEKREVASIVSDIKAAIATKSGYAGVGIHQIPASDEEARRANRGPRLFQAIDGRFYMHFAKPIANSAKLKKKVQILVSQDDLLLPVEVAQINTGTFELYIPMTPGVQRAHISVSTDKKNNVPVTFKIKRMVSHAKPLREGDPAPDSLAFKIQSFQTFLFDSIHSVSKAPARTVVDMMNTAFSKFESIPNVVALSGIDLETWLQKGDTVLAKILKNVPKLRSFVDIRHIAHQELSGILQKFAKAVRLGLNHKYDAWSKASRHIEFAKDHMRRLALTLERTWASFEAVVAESKPWSMFELNPFKRAHERAAAIFAKVQTKRREERREEYETRYRTAKEGRGKYSRRKRWLEGRHRSKRRGSG